MRINGYKNNKNDLHCHEITLLLLNSLVAMVMLLLLAAPPPPTPAPPPPPTPHRQLKFLYLNISQRM